MNERSDPPASAPADTPTGALPIAAPGYLTRLVERVAPAEPTLRRRQPAMFENAPRETMATAPDLVVDTISAARPVHESTPSAVATPVPAPMAAAVAAPPAAASHGPAARETQSTRVTPPASRLPSEPPRVDATLRIVAVEVPSAAVAATAPPEPAVRTGVPTPKDRARAPAAAPRAPDRPPRAEVGSGPARRTIAPAAAAAPERNVRALPSPTPAVQTTGQRRTPAPVAGPAAARQTQAAVPPTAALRRHAPTASSAPLQPPRPRELPPIDITIGRIEVRAVAAPSPPKRSASAPQLGLDQYLRERGGQR
jgi:hypothetical protein